MASAVKSHWVTVYDGMRIVLQKQFFNINDAKKFQKEKREAYPDLKKFMILLENY